MVPREGFELDMIRSGGLKGKSILNACEGCCADAAGPARRVARSCRGGVRTWCSASAATAPGPSCSWRRCAAIPTLLLEQNAVPGLTNRLLARVVRAAARDVTSRPGRSFGSKAFVSGNPVRPEFFDAGTRRHDDRDADARRTSTCLIFGGSQGAHAINVAMVEAAPALAAATSPLRITHQTGERDLDMVRPAIAARRACGRGRAVPLRHGTRDEAADLVVCRAGATTLAELTAAGKPSILIPLPTATDDHQRKNAEVLASGRCGEIVLQATATGTGSGRRDCGAARSDAGAARAAWALRRPSAGAARRGQGDRGSGVGARVAYDA